MSKFTKSESTSNFNKLVNEVKRLDPADVINNYVYGEQAHNDLHYTLVIEPEIGTEDGETFITLNIVILVNNGRMLCLDSEYSSTELGYYNGTDKATVIKAYNKLMKAAKSYGLYVTELADYC